MAQVPFSRGDLLKNLLVDNSGLDTSEVLPDVPNEKKLLWFQNIVGVNETQFRTDLPKYMKTVAGKIEFHNPNGGVVKAGAFSLVKLGDLMQTMEAKTAGRAPKAYPHFEIVTRLDNASLRFVDVSFVQALPENNGALFQVASNFNGTEAQTELQEPEGENFTTKYVYDKTQGPAASISAGGAAISRVYAAFVDKSANPADWAQTSERQINFLDQLSEHFPVTNGYVTCKDPEPRFPRKQWKKLLGLAQIGLHQEVQVTTGYRYSDLRHKNQIIDQCFCAAMNLQQGGTGARNKMLPDGEIKAQFLLDAAYHGTYLTALSLKKTQIFLTLIGGGAFGNDKAWIFDSIFYAHQKWSRNDNSELNKVTLLLYNPTDISKVFLNKLRANNIPYTLVAYHNSKRIILEDFFA